MSDQPSPGDRRFPRREREHHADRNALIRAEFDRRKGEPGLLLALAKEHGLTAPRIHQIVNGRVRVRK